MNIRRTFLARAAALLACATAPACGEAGADAARLVAAVDTVDGVPRLSYAESGAPALGWSFDTAAVIGGFGVDTEDYQFDQVSAGGLAGDGAGNLFILDGAGKRVLGYDAGGSFLGSWGREGNGPGELAAPTGLGLGPGGDLWIPDHGNRRVTLLPRAEGIEPTSLPYPEGAGSMGGSILPEGDGAWAVLTMFSFRPGDDSGPPPLPLVHLTADGVYDDTVWVAERPHMDPVEAQAGGMMVMMLVQQAFAPSFLWERFSDGTFAIADGPEYDIRLVDPAGGEITRIARAPAARAPTAADMEAERERQRAMSPPSNIPGAEELMEKRLEALTFAPVIPRLTGLAVDGSDRLWVGVSIDVPGETGRIDVYDREGRLLGEIVDPGFFPDLLYGDGLVARLTEDELDVQQIVVYRLREGTAAD